MLREDCTFDSANPGVPSNAELFRGPLSGSVSVSDIGLRFLATSHAEAAIFAGAQCHSWLAVWTKMSVSACLRTHRLEGILVRLAIGLQNA